MFSIAMRFFVIAALLGAAVVAGPIIAKAQDFSKGSKAKEWGLIEEEKALFSGKVVDVICELTGDCADNCGNGDRNLAIIRSADNKLVPVLKNRQPAFNGATEDLLPYCNKEVEVDGVLVGHGEGIKVKVYMLQRIRVKGSKNWAKANLWTRKWAERQKDAKGKGPWFRRDPRVKKQIEATGYLGLGLDEDKRFRESQ